MVTGILHGVSSAPYTPTETYVASKRPEISEDPTDELTAEDKIAYSRYLSARAKMHEIPGLKHQHIRKLAGRGSGYERLNEAHHLIEIRAASIYLSRAVKKTSPVKRETFIVAFQWMTGYASFEHAWQNEDEERMFSIDGIEDPPTYDDSDQGG